MWLTPQACFVPSNWKWTTARSSQKVLPHLPKHIHTHTLPQLTNPYTHAYIHAHTCTITIHPVLVRKPQVTNPSGPDTILLARPSLFFVVLLLSLFPFLPAHKSSLARHLTPSSFSDPLLFPSPRSPSFLIPLPRSPFPLPYSPPFPAHKSSLARHLTPDMYRDLCGKTRMAEGWSIESASRSGVECPPTPVGNNTGHTRSTHPFNTRF